MRILARSIQAFLLCSFCATALLSAQTYRELTEYKLDAVPTSGIAVDSADRKLFAGTADGIAVLNADTGAYLGKIAGLTHMHDVLLIPPAEDDEHSRITKGFAGDDSGHVIAFSTADMKPLATMKLPTSGAVSLCFDSAANAVEAISASGSVASIDASSNKVIKSGQVPTGSGGVACGILNRVYVADPAANIVRVLNHDTIADEGDYPMKTCHKPSGLSLDTKGRRLFVGCEDGLIEIVDTDAYFTFIELKGGSGAARETFAWLPQGKGNWKAAVFIAHDDGTFSVVRMNAFINYSLGGQYKLRQGIGTIAYDEKTHHLICSNAASPGVLVVGYEPVS
jgi:DNA-binding beta-propeller fold protein YncE